MRGEWSSVNTGGAHTWPLASLPSIGRPNACLTRKTTQTITPCGTDEPRCAMGHIYLIGAISVYAVMDSLTLRLPVPLVWEEPVIKEHGFLAAFSQHAGLPALAALLQIGLSCKSNPPSCQ